MNPLQVQGSESDTESASTLERFIQGTIVPIIQMAECKQTKFWLAQLGRREALR